MGTNDAGGSQGGGKGNSDPALKTDIRRIGEHPLGFGVYLYRYKADCFADDGGQLHFGVMADEVRPIVPDAVSVGPQGYLRVDYGRLGIDDHCR